LVQEKEDPPTIEEDLALVGLEEMEIFLDAKITFPDLKVKVPYPIVKIKEEMG